MKIPLLSSLIAAILSACSLTPKLPQPTEKPRLKLGLALGGGAARGFAHIGVIKMLNAQGIVPDLVVGSSAGSVVGALYVSGLDPYAMQSLAEKLDQSVFADWGLPRLGFLNGQALEDFINAQLQNRPIEKLSIPFATVATDLQTGDMKIFREGNSGAAVRASSSVPGLFKPTNINGRAYVDGGLVSPVPVEAARLMGANVVIAVDIATRPEVQPVDSITNILWQTISIMGEKISVSELKSADFLIRPHLPYIKSWDFNARNLSILEGERAALTAIPNIKAKLLDMGWTPTNSSNIGPLQPSSTTAPKVQ